MEEDRDPAFAIRPPTFSWMPMDPWAGTDGDELRDALDSWDGTGWSVCFQPHGVTPS